MIAGAFVDEQYFAAISDRETGARLLLNVKDAVQRFLASDVATYVSPDVYSSSLGFDDLKLYEVVYQDPDRVGLDWFDARDVAITIDRCRHYTLDGARRDYSFLPEKNFPTASVTLDAIWIDETEGTFALIVSDDFASGLCSVKSGYVTKRVFFLGHSALFLAMVRSALASSQFPDADFTHYASVAFPDTVFAPDLLPSRTGLDLNVHMTVLVEHLAFLSDQFINIGVNANWDISTMQRECAAKGIDLSAESTRTKHTRNKIRQRQVSLELAGSMREISCTMHTKLTREQGRIHFGVEHVNGSRKMVIGIICDHLEI